MHPLEWIKEHPVTLALGLGGLLLVYVLMRAAGGGSSGGNVSYTSPQPSDAAIQAGAAVTMGQLQLQGQGQQINGELAVTNTNASRDITIAGLSADVAKYQTEQGANVQALGITATADVNKAGISSQEAIALANDATQAFHDQLAAAVTQTGYQEQTKQLGIVTQGYTDITRSNNSTALGMTQSNNGALVDINRSHDALALGVTQSNNATARYVTDSDNATALGITRSNNSIAIPLAKIDQKKQEVSDYYQYKGSRSSGGGILGAIVGGIASLF